MSHQRQQLNPSIETGLSAFKTSLQRFVEAMASNVLIQDDPAVRQARVQQVAHIMTEMSWFIDTLDHMTAAGGTDEIQTFVQGTREAAVQFGRTEPRTPMGESAPGPDQKQGTTEQSGE